MVIWKHGVIIVLAAAMVSCSKKAEETPAEKPEWPKHGLTEEQANEVLAKVGDRTITVGEFADRLAEQSPYLRARFESPERRKEFLDNLVRFELLVYEAKRRGYADKPEVIRARRNALIQELVKKEVDEGLQPQGVQGVSEEQVKAVYEQNPGEFDRPAEVRAGQIFIKDKAHAEEVLAKAKQCDLAAFRRLARDESEDEDTKKNGGDLQFFSAEAESPPSKAVRDAAFSLQQVGDVYPDLVPADGGYYVVMLTGKRAALKRTYEQAKRAIRHRLTRDRKQAAMDSLKDRLREQIPVEVDYDALREINIEAPPLPEGR